MSHFSHQASFNSLLIKRPLEGGLEGQEVWYQYKETGDSN